MAVGAVARYVGGQHSLYATTSNVVDVAKDATQDAKRDSNNTKKLATTTKRQQKEEEEEEDWSNIAGTTRTLARQMANGGDGAQKSTKIFWQANKNILH